jgi:tubulin monoglycylase TTLL3/8
LLFIEKPLLIHNRKFDIRIYFITFIRENCVDVWVYKDCYVKFGTVVFSLDSLHESIHVTNYAIQKRFMNSIDQVENARENMWSLAELKRYLVKIDKEGVWESQIYPAIKRNLTTVVLESLEATDLQKNNFELNGADFMIGFDYSPILIEINAKPALFFSPTVVEMITEKLLEDVIKVTVDWQRDQLSSTGDFELIYTHEIPKVEDSVANIAIQGKKIEKHNARIRQISEDKLKKPVKKAKKNSSGRVIMVGK